MRHYCRFEFCATRGAMKVTPFGDCGVELGEVGSAALFSALLFILCIPGCKKHEGDAPTSQSGSQRGGAQEVVVTETLSGALGEFGRRVTWSGHESLFVDATACKIEMPPSEGETLRHRLQSLGYSVLIDHSLAQERALAFFPNEPKWRALASAKVSEWRGRETTLSLSGNRSWLRREWIGFANGTESTVCYFLVVNDPG